MTQANGEFDVAIRELAALILREVPQTKAAITIAEKRDHEDLKQSEEGLAILRQKYTSIVRRLNALDSVRARKEISEIVEKAKQLDMNHQRDMVWAKIDNWGKYHS